MSKAKRFLCLVLAAVMSVSVLAACGKKVEENPQVTPDRRHSRTHNNHRADDYSASHSNRAGDNSHSYHHRG